MSDIDRCNVPNNIDPRAQQKWVFQRLKHPPCGHFFWSFASNVTILAVGIFSRFMIRYLNRSKVYNYDKFVEALKNRGKGVPLITVSNHVSCFDDPGIWGCLDWSILNQKSMRWSLTAHDICFTNSFHSYFFMLGKCVPVIRGKGVYQEAVDFCIEKLKEGEWLHIFPEGRVNANNEYIRFKWGLGRIIHELPVQPIIIPLWHMGMDDVLPNKNPYFFRAGKFITINFGSPFDLSQLVLKMKGENITPEVARERITACIQEKAMLLKEQTERLHLNKKSLT